MAYIEAENLQKTFKVYERPKGAGAALRSLIHRTYTEKRACLLYTSGEVADVCVGVVIKPTQYYADKGIPAFRSLNIGKMQVKDNDWVYFTEEGHQKNQKSIIHKNDVLVVRSGAPGTACVATEKYDG